MAAEPQASYTSIRSVMHQVSSVLATHRQKCVHIIDTWLLPVPGLILPHFAWASACAFSSPDSCYCQSRRRPVRSAPASIRTSSPRSPLEPPTTELAGFLLHRPLPLLVLHGFHRRDFRQFLPYRLMLHRVYNTQSFFWDVPGAVCIPIMVRAAIRAIPLTNC